MKHFIQKLAYNSADNSIFLAAGDRIQKFDGGSGNLLQEWVPVVQTRQSDGNETPKKKRAKMESKRPPDNIRTLTCSPDGRYVVASTDETKSLLVFLTKDLSLVKTQYFPKRPSAIAITKDSSVVLLGDKFGDVYALPISSESLADSSGLSTKADAENESGSEIEPILGHVSMLVDLTVIEDSNGRSFIITSDRDEHIRVTKYPQSYIIERFCLGHEQYVSQLLIPSWSPTSLISGGGDDFIAHWNWTTGELLEKFDIKSLLYPVLVSTDDFSSKEVAVSGIWAVPELQIIMIYDEIARKIVAIRLTTATAKLEYLDIFTCDVLDVAVTGSEGEFWISRRVEEDDPYLIKKYKIDQRGKITPLDDEKSKNISISASYDISSKDDIGGIHPIALLRKHAEH